MRKNKQPIMQSVYSVAEHQQLQLHITELAKEKSKLLSECRRLQTIVDVPWLHPKVEHVRPNSRMYSAEYTFDMTMVEQSYFYDSHDKMQSIQSFARRISQNMAGQIERAIVKRLAGEKEGDETREAKQ